MNDLPFLSLRNLHKAFDNQVVIQGFDLDVSRGETVCLLGPSGCGKTTLLHLVAGLEPPDRGEIWCDGENITLVPTHRRDFGLMFQDYALFPHLTVVDNVSFGLRMHQWPQAAQDRRVQELLDMVALSDFGARKVYELSGGQQQRVALARSLAPQPRLLMLDEPLGSLDRALRDQLLTELRQLLQNLHQTTLYVTHDQVEAFAIADRVVLMDEGRITQQGPPAELYLFPNSPFVARFLGFKNFLRAEVLALQPQPILSTEIGELQPLRLPPGLEVGKGVDLVIRPESARLAASVPPEQGGVKLQLRHCSYRGSHTIVRLGYGSGNLDFEFELPGLFPELEVGQEVCLTLRADGIVVFPP